MDFGSKSAVSEFAFIGFDGKVVLSAEVGICMQWNLAVNASQVECASKGICR